MLSSDDVVEIQRVLAEYGHVVDDHDWDRAGRVFADDFVFEMGGDMPDLHGIADIVATFKGRNIYAHHLTNVAVTQDEDGTVRAHSKMLCFPNEGPPFSGDCYDVMTHTADGWRIARRRTSQRHRQFFD